MSLQDEITKAIGAHGMWKTRLKTAIDAGTSEFSADQVAKDNACEFGKWIYGAGIPPETKKMPEYEACRHLHADFHKAAADVLRLALSGKKAEANAALVGDSKFATVSAELTRTMMNWKSLTH